LLLTAVSPDANITTEELKKDYDQYKIIDVEKKKNMMELQSMVKLEAATSQTL